MRSLRLLVFHSWFETLDLLRQPSYVVSTLVFPSMFFWFFGVPNAQDESSARLLTASFAAFGILGVSLFQFSVALAQERGTPWSNYLRVLPLPAWIHLCARLVSGSFFSLLAVAGVLIVSRIDTPANLSVNLTLQLFLVLILGAIPFGLLGLVLGLSTNAKSALPVANLVYLPLSFAGGLWIPPNGLPKIIQDISPYLPTRLLGELVWSVTLQKELATNTWQGLLLYAAVFGAISWVLFRKDQEHQFH